MEQEKYLMYYIEQLNKSIKLYNEIYSITDKYLCEVNHHYPIDWDQEDLFIILNYLYNYLQANNNKITSIICENLNEIFNIVTLPKLKEVNKIFVSNDLADFTKRIDAMISLPYVERSILEIDKYIRYTNDDITIIKKYILKIRDELINTANSLKIPDKPDWEVEN